MFLAKRAVRHLNTIYCCYPENALWGTHDRNIDAYRKEYDTMPKRRSVLLRAQDLDSFITNTTKYIEYFGLDKPDFLQMAKEELADIVLSPKYRDALRRQKEKADKDLSSLQEKIEMFRNFKSGTVDSMFQLLRYHTGEDKVQTSLGISIQSKEFCRLYSILKENASRLIGLKVSGIYEIKTVTDNLVVIGCHRITTEEIENTHKAILSWKQTF